jgi:cephalosporin-C deacetylase-like acetyl esterase
MDEKLEEKKDAHIFLCHHADVYMRQYSDDAIRYFIENLRKFKTMNSEKDYQDYWDSQIEKMENLIRERHADEGKNESV